MVSLIPRQPAKVFFFSFQCREPELSDVSHHLTHHAHTHTHRHADREAEPKDYDVCAPGVERNLLKATYTRIGNIDGVSYKHSLAGQTLTRGRVWPARLLQT